MATVEPTRLVDSDTLNRNDVGRRIAFVLSNAWAKVAEAQGKAGRPLVPAETLEGRLDQILAGALAAGLDPREYRVCWMLRAPPAAATRGAPAGGEKPSGGGRL